MKALDTLPLLDLLRGGPRAERFVRTLGAEEIATTELNLWELTGLALADDAPGRERRLRALERLRRRLIVLPIDAAAVAAATRLASSSGRAGGTDELIAGCLQAHGATSWVTDSVGAAFGHRAQLRIESYKTSSSKVKKRN